MGLPKISITVPQEIYLDDLVEEIVSGCPHEKVVDFIKELDAQLEDWDITMELYRHFEILKKQYEEEVKK